ncbi:hypothetical protein D3C75_1355690 [compost metagenome]
MSEGVGTDDGLVGRDWHIAQLADQLAGAENFLMIDIGVQLHKVLTDLDGHDHFFQ